MPNDKKRLDWLSVGGRGVEPWGNGYRAWFNVGDGSKFDTQYEPGKTPRKAIDAAMWFDRPNGR